MSGKLRLPPPHLQGNLLLRESSWFKPLWRNIYTMTLADRLQVSANEDEFEKRNIIQEFKLDEIEVYGTNLMGSRKKFVFKIVEQNGKEYYFACKSLDELRDWSTKLQKLASYWKRKFVAEKIKKEYDEHKSTTNNDHAKNENVMKLPKEIMKGTLDQSKSQFITSVILKNGEEKIITLDKEAKFQALFFEVSKDDGCPDCKICQIRSKQAELYVIKPDGQVCHVHKNEYLYQYHKSNSQFHLVELNNKLLVVYFEDSTFIVCQVAMTITADQLLALKPIQCKWDSLKIETGSCSVGVFYQTEGEQSGSKESIFNSSEHLISFFYDFDGAPKSFCGKLIVKDKTLRRVTILDTDKMKREAIAGKERAKLKQRDRVKEAVEAVKSGKVNSVLKIVNQNQSGTNSDNSSDVLKTNSTGAVCIPHPKLSAQPSVNFNTDDLDVDTCSPFNPTLTETLSSSASSGGSALSVHSLRSNSIHEADSLSPGFDTKAKDTEFAEAESKAICNFERNKRNGLGKSWNVEIVKDCDAHEVMKGKVFERPEKSPTSYNDFPDNSLTSNIAADSNDGKDFTDNILTNNIAADANDGTDFPDNSLTSNIAADANDSNDFPDNILTNNIAANANDGNDFPDNSLNNKNAVDGNDDTVVSDEMSFQSEIVYIAKPPHACNVTVREETGATSKVDKGGKISRCQVCADLDHTPPFSVKTVRMMNWALSGNCDYICLIDIHLRRCNGKWEFCDDTTPKKREIEDSWDQFMDHKHNVKKFNIGNDIMCSFVPAETKGGVPKWVVKRLDYADDGDDGNDVRNDFSPIVSPIDIGPSEVITKDHELDDSLSCEEPDFQRNGDDSHFTSTLKNIDVNAIKEKFSEKAKNLFNNLTQNLHANEEVVNHSRSIDDVDLSQRRQSLSNTFKGSLRDAKEKTVTRVKRIKDTLSQLQVNLDDSMPIANAENDYIMPNELIEIRNQYILPLEGIISKICTTFAESESNESYKIGDDSFNPSMGWLVRSNMCTIIASFISIGLKQNLVAKTFFKSKLMSLWSLVKNMSLSFKVREFDLLIHDIENSPVLHNDNTKFRQFFCEMLNRSNDNGEEKLIVSWFQHFPLSTHTAKFYVENSFWRMSYNMMFCVLSEEIVISLKLLNGLPFNLKMNFELNQQNLTKHYCNTGALRNDVACMLE